LDFAIYEAKQNGKRQVVFCDDRMMKTIRRRHDVQKALERAIHNQHFEIYYQPICCTADNEFHYVEALLRLKDSQLGNVSPSEFIPVAEEAGLIVEITYFVIDRVCSFMKTAVDWDTQRIKVAINLSAVHFNQSNMVSRILEITKKYGIDPIYLKFEITESMMVKSFDQVKMAMIQLASYGVEFALDDYGQGYSNIVNLLQLPFSTIKLDRSIICSIEDNREMVGSLINALKSLGMDIVAEGVETEEQSIFLRKYDCDYLQGFLFARPMPQNELQQQLLLSVH